MIRHTVRPHARAHTPQLVPHADELRPQKRITDNAIVHTDFCDLTSLFQNLDGSGGNPNPGDPVGLVLNKAGMGGQTAEAYIAGLPDLADVDTQTTINVSSATRNGAGWDLTAANTFPVIQQALTIDAGYWFRVTATWSGNTNGRALNVNCGGVIIQLGTAASGEETLIGRATGEDWIRLGSGNAVSGDTFYFEITSIKRIPNEHLTAPADNQRPVLRKWPVTGRNNFAEASEDFSEVFVARALFVGNKLVETTGTGAHYARFVQDLEPSTTYTLWAEVEAAERPTVKMTVAASLGWAESIGREFDLNTGNLGPGAAPATIADLGNGRYLCAFNATTNSEVRTRNFDIILHTGATDNYTGDGASGLFIHRVQINPGTAVQNYQKVINENDITEAGVPSVYSPVYDGVDDGLVGSDPIYGDINHSMFFAVKAGPQDDTKMYSESASVNGQGFFSIGASNFGLFNTVRVFIRRGNGTTALSLNSSAVAFDNQYRIVEWKDRAGDYELYVDGVLGASGSYTPGTINVVDTCVGNVTSAIGSAPLDGQLIGPIIVETSKLTNSLRRTIEQHLKRKAGIQ